MQLVLNQQRVPFVMIALVLAPLPRLFAQLLHAPRPRKLGYRFRILVAHEVHVPGRLHLRALHLELLAMDLVAELVQRLLIRAQRLALLDELILYLLQGERLGSHGGSDALGRAVQIGNARRVLRLGRVRRLGCQLRLLRLRLVKKGGQLGGQGRIDQLSPSNEARSGGARDGA